MDVLFLLVKTRKKKLRHIPESIELETHVLQQRDDKLNLCFTFLTEPMLLCFMGVEAWDIQPETAFGFGFNKQYNGVIIERV